MNTYLTEEDIIYQLANLKQITFEVTDVCNLKCTYCGYGEFYSDSAEKKTKIKNRISRFFDHSAYF